MFSVFVSVEKIKAVIFVLIIKIISVQWDLIQCSREIFTHTTYTVRSKTDTGTLYTVQYIQYILNFSAHVPWTFNTRLVDRPLWHLLKQRCQVPVNDLLQYVPSVHNESVWVFLWKSKLKSDITCTGDFIRAFHSNVMLSLSRDPVTNTSGLTLEQLNAFKKVEEITGTEQWGSVYWILFIFSFYQERKDSSFFKCI